MVLGISTARFVASGFGSGWLVQRGAGTAGSIAATLVWFLLWFLLGHGALFVEVGLLVLLLGAGALCVEKVLADGDREDSDPSWVVIDEWVGVGLTITLCRPEFWQGWICCFVLFRIFDIWKPGIVRRAELLPGAVGVMSDDLIAGVLAAIVYYAVFWL